MVRWVFFVLLLVTALFAETQQEAYYRAMKAEEAGDIAAALKAFEEAAALPGGRMLTRFIGPKDLVEPECYTANIRTGDRFLLCSDGLTLHIPPDEICTILEQKKNISEAIKVLFRRTFLRGAMDNSTGILVQAL